MGTCAKNQAHVKKVPRYEKEKETYDAYLRRVWHACPKLKLFLKEFWNHNGPRFGTITITTTYELYGLNGRFLTPTKQQRYQARLTW